MFFLSLSRSLTLTLFIPTNSIAAICTARTATNNSHTYILLHRIFFSSYLEWFFFRSFICSIFMFVFWMNCNIDFTYWKKNISLFRFFSLFNSLVRFAFRLQFLEVIYAHIRANKWRRNGSSKSSKFSNEKEIAHTKLSLYKIHNK